MDMKNSLMISIDHVSYLRPDADAALLCRALGLHSLRGPGPGPHCQGVIIIIIIIITIIIIIITGGVCPP